MATAPEQTDVDTPDTPADAAPPVADDTPPDNGEDSPYAPLAKELGWVSRTEYNGDGEWKDPETFIKAGRDIQRETSRELKAVRSTLDTMAKTSASIVQQQVEERVNKLAAQYTRAVEDGDPAAAFRYSREIDAAVSSVQQPQAQGPSPDAQSFAERNQAWFNKPGNEYATSRAIEICNTLAAQGYSDHATQLRIAEQRLKQELPQLFTAAKPPAGVNAPGSRGAGPSNRAKGFSDLPPEAQKVARDMAERNDGFKVEDYARNYFANLEGKA